MPIVSLGRPKSLPGWLGLFASYKSALLTPNLTRNRKGQILSSRGQVGENRNQQERYTGANRERGRRCYGWLQTVWENSLFLGGQVDRGEWLLVIMGVVVCGE